MDLKALRQVSFDYILNFEVTSKGNLGLLGEGGVLCGPREIKVLEYL